MSSLFSRFKAGLQKTATAVKRSFEGMFTDVNAWDNATFEDLEVAFIQADFGVQASTGIVKEIRDQYQRGLFHTGAVSARVAR